MLYAMISLWAAVGLLVSAWYYCATYFAARRFLGRKKGHHRNAADVELPGVTILKPLKGLDADLFENLATFCRQDYPRFQIVFAVADRTDASLGVIRRLRQVYPDVDMQVVVDGRIYGPNYKVSNLVNAYRHAKYDYIVVADSDIRVSPDYLRNLVSDLCQPDVGVVTCVYRATPVGGVAARLEALFVNTDFSPSVFVAQVVEPTRYAFGATMAIRRSVLEEIGGFEALAPYLADDFFLGHFVSQRGYRVVVSDMVVETVLTIPTWRRLVEHQLRWARTHRSVRPFSYFALSLTYGTLWAILQLILHPTWPAAWVTSVGLLMLRLCTAYVVATRYLGATLTKQELVLLPLKDLFVAAMWAAAFASNRVTWSGRHFRLIGGGEMVPLEAATAVPFSTPAEPKTEPASGNKPATSA